MGFLKKYKYLNPDVYLINVFTGNDFREALVFEDNRENISNVYKNFMVRVKKRFYNSKKKKIPFTQRIEQTLYFKSFPKEKEKAMALAKKYLLEIKEICKVENIKLIVTQLPTKTDVNSEFEKKVLDLFELSPNEMNINRSMALQLQDWLNVNKIENYIY